MPSASLHLTHAELLAAEPELADPIRRAMQREITYARLGSVFPDIPFYTNIVTMMVGYWLEMPAEHCPFAQKLHRYHPDLLAWHLLTEVRRDGLLPEEQRLAIMGGFFAHYALDLELHPLVNWCARRDVLLRGGHESHHHRLCEKYHSLFFHRDMQGADVVGRPSFFREKCRILERPQFFRLSVGEPVVRWCTDVLAGFYHEGAPSVRQFASWVRAFRHFSFMVSLPAAQRNSDRLGTPAHRAHYYENGDFSFMEFWERGYRRSVELINLAYETYRAGDFADEKREAFLRSARIEDLSYPTERGLPPLTLWADLEQGYQLTG